MVASAGLSELGNAAPDAQAELPEFAALWNGEERRSRVLGRTVPGFGWIEQP